MAAEPAKRRRQPAAKKTPAKKAAAPKRSTSTKPTPPPTPPTPPYGPCEQATRDVIAGRREAKEFTPDDEVNAALAIHFARNIDGGEPVTMTTSWTKELRQALAALGSREVPREPGTSPPLPQPGLFDDDWTIGAAGMPT